MAAHFSTSGNQRRDSYAEAIQSPVSNDFLSSLSINTNPNAIVQHFSASTGEMRERRHAMVDLADAIELFNTEQTTRSTRLGDRRGGQFDLNAGGLVSNALWQLNPTHPFARPIVEIWEDRQASLSTTTTAEEEDAIAMRSSFEAPENLTELKDLVGNLGLVDASSAIVIREIDRYSSDKEVKLAANSTITQKKLNELQKHITTTKDPVKKLLICAALLANPTPLMTEEILGDAAAPFTEFDPSTQQPPKIQALKEFGIGILLSARRRSSGSF